MARDKNRRQDGTLRPTVARRRRRQQQKRRAYWKHRKPFTEATEKESRIWNGEDLQTRLGGISYAEAGERLAKVAEVRGWIVFRDRQGRVHAVGKPKQDAVG